MIHDSAENSDPLKPIADILFKYLHDTIYNPSSALLDIKCLPETFWDLGKGLQYLNSILSETRVLAQELSTGNLNCVPPSQNNEIASPLKSLQASLRHLAWQTQQVAKGDYNQRVDFMGDFSDAFNNMIQQLEQRHQINLEEKTELEMYVQLILANTPNLLLLFNKEKQLVYASDSCFRNYKVFNTDDLTGKNIHDLLIPMTSEESVNEIKQLYELSISENRTMETELEIIFDNDNSHRYFKIQITPMLDANNIFRGVMMFLLDMTENVHARREAEEARKLAEQSSQSKTVFLAKMSHEIRTPMNAIVGMTELAMREKIPPAAQEHILTIRQAGANLLSIINDILDFSKIETGNLEIIPKNYPVASLINDVISIIRIRVIDSQVRFLVNVDNEIPCILFGDEVRMRQILLNILSNAVKYTKEGFVTFTISGKKIDEETISIIIEVIDSGIGIRKNDIPKLFNEFTQFGFSKDFYIEGTGLGLAITRKIIEAMHGSIDVESEYGKGSVFTIKIPQKYYIAEKIASVKNPNKQNVLVYEDREIYAASIIRTLNSLGIKNETVSAESEFLEAIQKKQHSYLFISLALFDNVKSKLQKPEINKKIVLLANFGEIVSDTSLNVITMPVHSISIANMLNGVSDSFNYVSSNESMEKFTAPDTRVLIVDDIITNLKVAEGLLLPYKMQVYVCKTGMMAIEMVKTIRFDAVFMDHMMPEMDGIETTMRIRALGDTDPYYKNVPIIALTANAVSGTEEMFYKNGFDDFLSKPIDTIQLNAVLERWIPKEKQISSTGINRTIKENYDITEKIKISGINIKKGITITGGSVKNYLKTLAVFYKDGTEKIDEIKKCLETKNLPLYTIHIHALKSACGNIGAEELSETAKTLEMAGKQRDLDFILTNNTVFISDLETMLVNIHKALRERREEAKNEAPVMETLKVHLSELREALNELDSKKIKKIVTGLNEYTEISDIGKTVEKILEYVLIGGYDEAAAIIDSLL